MRDQHAEHESDAGLTDAFWSAARVLRQASMASLARWDVTPSQARALRVLGRHDEMRLSELSDHLHIAARSTTEVVDDLEAKHLVERRPDPDDRRATLVALTRQGENVTRTMREARDTTTERVFDRLEPADRAELIRILQTLAR